VYGQSIARQRFSKHVITQATIEVRVFAARCWVTNATMGSLLPAPRQLLCNDTVNKFQQWRRSFLCGRAEATTVQYEPESSSRQFSSRQFTTSSPLLRTTRQVTSLRVISCKVNRSSSAKERSNRQSVK
jgi:hypothetical protein